MANSISVKLKDIDNFKKKVEDFKEKTFEPNEKNMKNCCYTGPEDIDISSEPIDKMQSSLERFITNLKSIKELIEKFSKDKGLPDGYSDGLTDEYLKEMLPLIYVSENSQDEYKNKITEDSWLKVAESDATYDLYSDSLLQQKISVITGAIKANKTTSLTKDPEGNDTGTAAARNTAAITSTGSFTSAVQPRYSSTESSSQTNLTQNNDTSANTSKNTFSSSDSKSNTSTTSPETTSPTTTSPETTSPTTSTPSSSQTPSSTILTPKNNSNSEQVHTGGGYSSSGGYTGTGDYNPDTSTATPNATPSTPGTPETVTPGNTSKLTDEELASIKNVIDNSKTHTTTIPKSNTPINSNTKSGGGGSSVIPIAAGLTAAAAAGLGAKAYLDRKNNNDNGSSDEINTDEWTGDESVDIKYDDSSDNQEEATLDADDDYTYQSSDENEKYDAKANNELTDLQ